MRLLIINHFPLEGSGSGIYTKNIAARMKDRGIDVKTIVINSHKNKDNYSFPVRTIVYPEFPCFTSHPKSSSTFYDLSRQEMNEYFNLFYNTIKKEVEEFKPDLIHCQHLWVAPYVARKTKIPYLITAHGTDIKGFKKDKRYHNAALKGAEGAEKIITISKRVHNQVKKYYNIEEDKLKLIWNGFDEKLFHPKEVDLDKLWRRVLPTKKNFNPKKIVSFVGKLTHFKGVDILLKAGSKYEAADDDITTLIIGSGDLDQKLKKQAERLDLKNFYFLGNLPQKLIVKINNIADIAVVPSRDEPFGLVALEALACGTPVIATNTGGLTDFINEKIGRLIPEEDPAALAEAVISSIKKNDKDKKGKIAYNYAHNNFSWNRVADDLEALYRSIRKEEI